MTNPAGYIALVHKDQDTSYGVSFPDVPGCIAAGDTFNEAIGNGSEALAGHLALMEADGDPLPEARTLEQLKSDSEFLHDAADAVIALVVPAPALPTTVRFEAASAPIKEVAYEKDRRELLITFGSGQRYIYDNVPTEIVEAFKAAPSKGAFFHREIRDRFSHREFAERFLVAADG